MNELSLTKRDAVARLCQAQADGLLSVEVFEQRYVLIRDATTPTMVQAIVADLDDVADREESRTSLVPVAGTPLPVEAAPAIRIPAILGSAKRAGTWTVPEEIRLLVVLGEAVLDFRDASFTTDTVVIDATVRLGQVTLIVPPGTQVENECREFLSASKHPSRGRGAAPNGLLVIVQGSLFMAELVVKEKKGGR